MGLKALFLYWNNLSLSVWSIQDFVSCWSTDSFAHRSAGSGHGSIWRCTIRFPRGGGPRMQKLSPSQLRIQLSQMIPFKPEAAQKTTLLRLLPGIHLYRFFLLGSSGFLFCRVSWIVNNSDLWSDDLCFAMKFSLRMTRRWLSEDSLSAWNAQGQLRFCLPFWSICGSG